MEDVASEPVKKFAGTPKVVSTPPLAQLGFSGSSYQSSGVNRGRQVESDDRQQVAASESGGSIVGAEGVKE